MNKVRKTKKRRDGYTVKDILGSTKFIEKMVEFADISKRIDGPLMLYGEVGTGKKLLARVIHNQSAAPKKHFVDVSCRKMCKELPSREKEKILQHVHERQTLSMELLKRYERKGIIKIETDYFYNPPAAGYLDKLVTIYLDGIEHLEADFQKTTIYFLDHLRGLSKRSITDKYRVIGSTTDDLSKLVDTGMMNRELYVRLNVLDFKLLPLRERVNDIPHLVNRFTQIFNQEYGKELRGFTDGAMQLLMDYPWPGNINELKKSIRHIYRNGSGSSGRIKTEDLSFLIEKGLAPEE